MHVQIVCYCHITVHLPKWQLQGLQRISNRSEINFRVHMILCWSNSKTLAVKRSWVCSALNSPVSVWYTLVLQLAGLQEHLFLLVRLSLCLFVCNFTNIKTKHLGRRRRRLSKRMSPAPKLMLVSTRWCPGLGGGQASFDQSFWERPLSITHCGQAAESTKAEGQDWQAQRQEDKGPQEREEW